MTPGQLAYERVAKPGSVLFQPGPDWCWRRCRLLASDGGRVDNRHGLRGCRAASPAHSAAVAAVGQAYVAHAGSVGLRSAASSGVVGRWPAPDRQGLADRPRFRPWRSDPRLSKAHELATSSSRLPAPPVGKGCAKCDSRRPRWCAGFRAAAGMGRARLRSSEPSLESSRFSSRQTSAGVHAFNFIGLPAAAWQSHRRGGVWSVSQGRRGRS